MNHCHHAPGRRPAAMHSDRAIERHPECIASKQAGGAGGGGGGEMRGA